MTNLPNSQTERAEALFRHLHRERHFFPTDRQRDLYRALATHTLDPTASDETGGLALLGYGGAMGGGKTRALVELAIDSALLFPGNNILLARDAFTDLATTAMAEFFQYCPPRYIRKRRQSPTHAVELAADSEAEPSTIHFRHLSDWTGLGSQQYGTVLVDEAGEVEAEAAQMLVTRLRHPAQPQPWFVAASNPYPGWFEQWFVKRELPEDALQRAQGRVIFIPARVGDNPHLPQNYADTQRAILPADWVERFIEGRFDAFKGQIYPHFDPERHRWDAPLPNFRRLIGGLDFGSESETGHYTAGIVAGLTDADAPGGDNVLIRLAEFEQRGPGVTQRLEQWMRRCQRQFGRIAWCADRSQSAWIQHMRHQRHPVRPSRGGRGSVQVGIARVQERLSHQPPQSFYLPALTQFPLRMREYRWKQSPGHNPEPRKRNDDLLDADRYLHELAQTAAGTAARIQIGPDSDQQGRLWNGTTRRAPPPPKGAMIPILPPGHRNPWSIFD